MRHRVGADGARDLDLALCDQRARDRGAEEIDAFIERVRAEHREDIVTNEFLAEVLDEDLADAQHLGLGACRFDFLTLADIGGEGDDLRVVAVLEPAQDDRGVEPAGIGKHDFFDVFLFHGVSHNGSSCGPQRRFSPLRMPLRWHQALPAGTLLRRFVATRAHCRAGLTGKPAGIVPVEDPEETSS